MTRHENYYVAGGGVVPNSLEGWTLEVIQSLCAAGQCESDRHDFKLKLPEAFGHRKVCCAFANTYGGFIILGIADNARKKFEVVGLEPNKELYGEFVQKLTVEPSIAVPLPKIIEVPDCRKMLYVFEIPQSPRRPHLPSAKDERIFWKRQGSQCEQMTLEEIRYQMNSYEEKREKLTLLLIDLHHKAASLEAQSNIADGVYVGDVYSFEIIDRVVVETYAVLKDDLTTIGALDTIKRSLMTLNAEKQKLLNMLALSYSEKVKLEATNGYRERVRAAIPSLTIFVEQIERSFKEKFGIENPYKYS